MAILQFIAVVLFLELTPGPNMAYLAMLTVLRGRGAGFFAVIGILAGLALHAVLAALGAAIVIEKFPLVYEVLRWTGVGYLFYLAWSGWRTEKEVSPGKADLKTTAGPLVVRGFLSNVFNPKALLFFVSVMPGFIEGTTGAPPVSVQMAMLGGLYLGIATLVHGVIVLLAAQLRPYLVSGKRLAITRKTLSLLLALVALWLAWTTRR